MSTVTEIARLQTARNTLRDKFVEFGLVTNTAKLDAIAAAAESIENKGAISASVQEGDTYTIPKGYHNGSGTVSGVAGGGNYNLQSKTATPTKSQQSITPDQGYYGLSDVTVAAIPPAYQNVSSVNATAADVLASKIIVNALGETVVGTMPNNGAVEKTIDVSENNKSYTIPKGYHNGNGAVSVTPETKTTTPTKSAQDITPTAGKVLSKVTVAAIPDKYQDVSGVTATAADVLTGKKFVSTDGVLTEGEISISGSFVETLDSGNTECVIPKGYYDGTAAAGRIYIETESVTVTPSEELKRQGPTTGKVITEVVVNPIPEKYINALEKYLAITRDLTDLAAAGNILEGKHAYVAQENTNQEMDIVKIDGTMKDYSSSSFEIDALAEAPTLVLADGYYGDAAEVTISNTLEQALAAI